MIPLIAQGNTIGSSDYTITLTSYSPERNARGFSFLIFLL
jgi:hypothetical protein